jgi:hypothetical protein
VRKIIRFWSWMALSSTVSVGAVDTAEIRLIIANRVESGRAVGIIVGVIGPTRQQIIAGGADLA